MARWSSRPNRVVANTVSGKVSSLTEALVRAFAGLCTEDERVWGSTEWGNGYQGPMFKGNLPEAVSHADGICLDSTVWLDDKIMVEDGRVVHPELVETARAMGK